MRKGDIKLTSVCGRGVLSTILLYKVDVGKSRKECEAFIAAEASREAFAESHFDAAVIEKTTGVGKT